MSTHFPLYALLTLCATLCHCGCNTTPDTPDAQTLKWQRFTQPEQRAKYVYEHSDGPCCMQTVSYVVEYRGRYLDLEFRNLQPATRLEPVCNLSQFNRTSA